MVKVGDKVIINPKGKGKEWETFYEFVDGWTGRVIAFNGSNAVVSCPRVDGEKSIVISPALLMLSV